MFRYFSSLATVALLASPSLGALAVTVDDFSDAINSPAEGGPGATSEFILNVYADNGVGNDTPQTATATDSGAGILGTTRITTITHTGWTGGTSGQGASTVEGFGTGAVTIANNDFTDSSINFQYDANGADLSSTSGAEFFSIGLLGSDLNSFDFTVKIVDDSDTNVASSLSGTFQQSVSAPQQFDFFLTNFTIAAGASSAFDFETNTLGELDLTIDGAPGFDLTLDSFGFGGLPEPSSIATLGLLAVGGIVTARRRRKK